MAKKNDYDVIVIGAGIGGLVCGCYLAKSGMRTLIVEKNPKAGGYCTSFTSNGMRFDSFVHSLGGCRENGIISNIIKDFNLKNRIKLRRSDPCDTVISPDHQVCFRSDIDRTISSFQESFPKEKNAIKDFFYDISHLSSTSLIRMRGDTFGDLLGRYFNDDHLKAILSIPVLGNMGLPPSLASAFSAVKLYTEFMMDGGYYFEGGMQVFPDSLTTKFKELGGDIALSTSVKKIKVKNGKIEGVVLKQAGTLSSKYIVSSTDAVQTFFQLLGEKVVGTEFLDKLTRLKPSLSMFILHLGLRHIPKGLPKEGTNVWFIPHYDIEGMYKAAKNRSAVNLAEYMVHISSEKTMSVFINACFRDIKYWHGQKELISDSLIKMIKKTVPVSPDNIIYRQPATPQMLYKYTLNYEGAAYGWASTPSQFAEPGLSQTTGVRNLYLAGHWTTLAQGVSGVAYLGRDTANIILKKEAAA